jgi:hypothetical protein
MLLILPTVANSAKYSRNPPGAQALVRERPGNLNSDGRQASRLARMTIA